jgi:hypothetical protein
VDSLVDSLGETAFWTGAAFGAVIGAFATIFSGYWTSRQAFRIEIAKMVLSAPDPWTAKWRVKFLRETLNNVHLSKRFDSVQPASFEDFNNAPQPVSPRSIDAGS